MVHFLTNSFSTTGTPLNIQVWDADSGLEFANDLIANVTEYVIPCSVMDSIDEPKTAWKDGELDPIAIKSNGGCWVIVFKCICPRMAGSVVSNQYCCTHVSHSPAGKMAVPWRRQVKNGYRLKATCQETAWVPLWSKADKDKYSTFPSGFYCTNVTGATCLVRAACVAPCWLFHLCNGQCR